LSLRRSRGGVFEIRADGRLAFSKKATGRFPTSEEIADCLT
jgi:selT/selW/selH-like putative selenoprotein